MLRIWHRARACYRFANILTHHLLGFLVKTALVLYFLFCLTFLALRYAVLPNIEHYKPDVERLVSDAINQPVVIGKLSADWDGLRPRIALDQLSIKDGFGRPALTLPHVQATVSWLSVPTGGLRLHELEIDNPDMDVRRDSAGNLYVAGILVPQTKGNDNRGADWLLSQREIVIRHGTLRWNDNLRGAPELPLSEINLELRNHWYGHQFALHATPPAAMAAPIDFRADFTHPAFAASIADATLWKGQLYLDLGQTDLAAWGAYVAFPKSFAIQRGHGALRSWLDFDRAKIADFTADLSLADTALRFGDLPVLELDKVSGRIGVREDIDKNGIDGTPTLGAHGHSMALTNFSFVTNDGMMLPPTSISETFEPAGDNDASKTTVSATLIDLQTMATFASRLPFSPEWRQILADYDPRGRLRDFTASWQGNYPAISAYSVKGGFAGLSMKGQAAKPARPRIGKLPAQAAVPFIPGFDNLTGHVEMNERGGDIALDSSNLQIELPGVFTDAMVPLQKLAMQANWAFQDKNKMLFSVASMDVARDGLAASASGTYLVTNQPGVKATGFADFSSHVDHFDFNKIEQYLPANADEHFRDWITHGLLAGSLRDATIKVKGDMKDFPFRTNPGEKPKGEFTAEGRIVDGVLNYDSHPSQRDPRKPLWPWLEDIQGTLRMDRARLQITADRAKTHNTVVAEAKAVTDEVGSPKGILDVTATINGAMPDYLSYVQESPVQQMIGGFTDDSHATGNARLSLKITMPLGHMLDTKASGKLQFMGDDIALFSNLPPLNNSSGVLEFSERGFNINNVHATFLGGPATISGGGPGDTAAIRGEGTLTAEGVRKYGAENGFGKLAQHITGSTHYSVAINVRKKHTDLVVDSNLNGLSLDLPAPLHKEAGENMGIRFEMLGLNSPDPNLQREEVKIALGSAVNARYEREKSPDRSAPWHLARGTIGVFSPTTPPAKGVLLNVNLKSLNVDAWSDLIAAIASDKAPPGSTPPAPGTSLGDLFNPDTFAIRTGEMTVFGHKIDNVTLNASRQNEVWQAKVGSVQATGNLSYSPQGKGLVTAKLDSLFIPRSEASQVADLLEGKSAMQELPALDIEVQNFDLLDKHLGKLIVKASNGRKDGANVWNIDDLQVDNPDATLKANGDWVIRNNENHSHLSYTLDLKNAGGTLDRLGFANVLSKGKGNMAGEVSWNGVPYSLDVPSLSGKVTELKVEKGQFLKGDAGAAKLLGVLSLQSIPRRLTLDFRDVFSSGFAFDILSMTANVENGVLSTKDLKMAGLDATVAMEGSADMVNETQNLHVVVVPRIDASAASLGYILINPAIGVGTFLAQLFLKDPLSKALAEEMQITGPWADPKVTKINNKADKKAADAGTAAGASTGK
jgi:uncharacterized protein (TIGR02099 family)